MVLTGTKYAYKDESGVWIVRSAASSINWRQRINRIVKDSYIKRYAKIKPWKKNILKKTSSIKFIHAVFAMQTAMVSVTFWASLPSLIILKI
jgi:hypothetical protein